MREIIDMYAVMQHVPELTGMDLVWRNNSWEGRYYLNGERHAYKRDKLRIKFWVNDKSCGIWLHEQGGESMSLQNWLQRYGGASDWKEAMDMMRGNSTPKVELLNYVRSSEIERKYVSREEFSKYREYDLRSCPLFVWMCVMYGENAVREIWHTYNVTTDYYGNAVFWYVDIYGNICHDKRISYHSDGHRNKKYGAMRKYKVGDGFTARTLFGAHLIPESGDYYVTESEKSCLLLALETGKTVVSTGGKGNIRDVDDRMILLPDRDAWDEWFNKGARCLDWFSGWENCGEHSDIGDMIVEYRNKGLKFNDSCILL